MADQTITQSVTTNSGTIIGVLHQGATADEIVEALRKAGLLPRLTTRLPEEPFRQLLDIVGRVRLRDPKDFSRLYYATLPPLAVRPLLQTTLPAELLSDLCEWQSRNGWPPLFEFVERLRLADGIDPAISGELQRWVEANAGRVTPPLSTGEIESLRKHVRTMRREDTGVTFCLQICLEPDLLNYTLERKQPLFAVYPVLRNMITNTASTLETVESKRLCALEDLPSLLDEIFFANQKYANEIPDIRQLLIEVVASSDVLLYAFEHWKHNNNNYGADFPLVVRLLDRLIIPDWTQQNRANEYWKDKWNTFQSTVGRYGYEALEWRAQDELDEYELQDDADLACLGLSFPLLPDKHDVFDVLRNAGIPVAIWLRGSDLGPVDPASLPERIKTLIEGKPLSDLFKTVQKVRRSREVRNDEKHIGNALTLLWDDPDRIPPKYDEKGTFV